MVISTDGINHFIGNDYYIQSTLAIAKSELSSFLTNFLGSSGRYSISSVSNSYLVDWRANIPDEVFTNNCSTNNNPLPSTSFSPIAYARFSHNYGFVNSLTASNYCLSCITSASTASGTSNNFKIDGETMNNTGISTAVDDTYLCWLTADERSLASFTYNPDNNYRAFIWTGVMQDFPAIQGNFPRNCAAIAAIRDGDGSTVFDAYRVGLEDSLTKQSVLTSGDANYAIACVDAQTPGTDLWASDLFLIDDDTGNGNPATGRCSNMLIAKGASFNIGQMYQLNTAHRDGGSPYFICVADWGIDKLLMRMTDSISS